MSDANRLTGRLLEDVAPFVVGQQEAVGIATPVPRLTVWTATHNTLPTPAVFKPIFYLVLRGATALIMGPNRLQLAAGACVVSSFELPCFYQLTGALPGLPHVGVSLHLDAGMLKRVVPDTLRDADRSVPAVAEGRLSGKAGDAFARLVGLLKAPEDIEILAPNYETELYYRLLQSPMGNTLRQISDGNERVHKLRLAADWLAAHPGEPVAIHDLAATAGMSVTSFHRHFKAVTGYSPLVFQRQMRLREARKLLEAGNMSVSAVAYKVGYLSPSQFSREYKTMFGVPPIADFQGGT